MFSIQPLTRSWSEGWRRAPGERGTCDYWALFCTFVCDRESRAYDGTNYTPGVVGLNNIKANDYLNVILQVQVRVLDQNPWCDLQSIQAMSHVEGLRNYFLNEDNYKDIKRPPGDISFQLVTRWGVTCPQFIHIARVLIIIHRFGELIRKLWNVKNFKAHVSPHEMLQAVVLCSKKKFQITEQVIVKPPSIAQQ